MLIEYTVRGLAGQIQCSPPSYGRRADPISAQARQLYDALEYPKRFILFTEEKKALVPTARAWLSHSSISERTTGWTVSFR